MRIVINLDKNLALFILILILIAVSMGFTFAQAGLNPLKPWHPLQQITNNAGSVSVDANADGLIDNSEDIGQVQCRLCHFNTGIAGATNGCGGDYPVEAGRLIDDRYKCDTGSIWSCGGGTVIVPDDVQITGMSHGCVLPMITNPSTNGNGRNRFSVCCRA